MDVLEELKIKSNNCTIPGWASRAGKEIERLRQSEREGWRYADELEQERKRLQALIDTLMLEYCPEGMTREQVEEWARNQKSVEIEFKVPNAELRGASRLHGEASLSNDVLCGVGDKADGGESA